MEVRRAVRMINSGLLLRPGWRVKASPWFLRGTILLDIELDTYETAEVRARQGYPERIVIPGGVTLYVTDLDEIGLHYAVIQKILAVEEHEWREFYRVLPSYKAPFHPHQDEGIEAWEHAAAAAGRPRREVIAW